MRRFQMLEGKAAKGGTVCTNTPLGSAAGGNTKILVA